MLIENKGIKTDKYFIPPFDLNEGEIIVIHLGNGQHFYEAEIFLKDIFTGKTINNNLKVNRPLKFVEHFFEPTIRRLIYPVTVGEYLRKNANLKDKFSEKIFETNWINTKTKVNTLAGNPRKLLSLYSTLSKTKNIVFDLAGQDAQGAKDTYEIVKTCVNNGGSAILLDSFDDMKTDCTKYIELEWLR
jgi:hypothetical protein